MKPYLIVVEDPSSDKLLNVALVMAETEQRAEDKAQALFPGLPEQDFCVYDVHGVSRDFPDGWTYQD